MKVLFDMGHPAHVHLFKNIINNLKREGHKVKITARNKEVTLALLKAYGFEYENRGEIYSGMVRNAYGLVKIDLKLLRIAQKFIILRFISWGASHDTDLHGIQKGAENDMIQKLSRYGKVFITSEKPLDGELLKYRMHVPPEQIHSILPFAQMYIGEGGTMAVEAGILGTPAIHIESTSAGQATGETCGNFLELRDTFELIYLYLTREEALVKALGILENPRSKEEWQEKQKKLWSDVIDVTAWLTDFIERYPESFYQYKKNNPVSK